MTEQPEPTDEEIRALLALRGGPPHEPDEPGIGSEEEWDGTLLIDPANEEPSVQDLLDGLDPSDSDVALALHDWLIDTGRLRTIGTLSGGIGYIYQYSEPQGTTRPGYTPGATQGGRMVDDALAKIKESGAKPKQIGMCVACMNVVYQTDDGTVVTNDDQKNPRCGKGGAHKIVY